MPIVPFDSLPGDARVWVFASDRALTSAAADRLLASVDAFLAQWNAHGEPLRCARAWRDDRFLAIGVDQSTAGASGCSIDGLFRTLKQLAPEIGADLLPAGRVYWRNADGAVETGDRRTFAARRYAGDISGVTPVFDTTASSAEAWRAMFERPAESSWHWQIAPRVAAAASGVGEGGAQARK